MTTKFSENVQNPGNRTAGPDLTSMFGKTDTSVTYVRFAIEFRRETDGCAWGLGRASCTLSSLRQQKRLQSQRQKNELVLQGTEDNGCS